MMSVPVAQAKNQFSELVARVERGETVAVTRRGKAVAQLVAFATEDQRQQEERVGQVFDRLRQLRSGVSMTGDLNDLKALAREGLD